MSHTLNALCVASVVVTPLLAQSTVRISVAPGNVEANDVSIGASISADGRFVAFQSAATNLVIADTNGIDDVFVRDRMTDATHRVSVHSFGSEGDGPSGAAVISATGRFVAFDSLATNLVATDTNNRRDVFVHDRVALTTQRVSLGVGGVESDGASSYPAISADGRFVAFQSRGTNLVANDLNGVSDIFVFDFVNATTVRVSVDSAGVEAVGASDSCSISASGDLVAFRSSAINLVANDLNGKSDIFVHQISNAGTSRVSVDSAGAEATGDSLQPRLSSDGAVVVFQSEATDLVGGDLNLEADIFLHTLANSATVRVSLDTAGVESNGPSSFPNVSADGSRVVFHSQATNLIASDLNGAWDVFIRDVANATTQRVSVEDGGAEGDNSSGVASLSANGRFIVFASLASNLVAGDTNAVNDVFLRDLCDPAVMNYCTAGTTASGCNASMWAAGVPSASAATSFTLHTSDVEGAKTGMMFYGLTGRLELPWGTGSSYRCVNIPVQRTPQQSTGGNAGLCDGTLILDWNAYLATHPNANGQPFSAGMIVDVQAWFRDPPSALSTSLSDGLEFCVGP